MSRRPHAHPPALRERPGLVWPCSVDPSGVAGPTPNQSRGPRWRRCSTGLYLPTDLDESLAVEQRIVAAAFLVLGKGAVTGWAGLRWAGARYLGERGEPVPLEAAGTGLRKQRGIELSREGAGEGDHLFLDGITITTHARSASYAARHAPTLVDAVNLLDRACAADLVSLAEVTDYASSRLAGATGVGRLREALALAVENSWSPTETEMRLLWRGIGLVDVLCNAPVFDLDGRHLGTPDLLDPVRGVVGEYDGADHLDRNRRDNDIQREGVFRRAGLEYVEMTAPDRHRPTDFLRRTLDAVSRVDPARKAWTLEAPTWWKRTETVEQRRALSDRDLSRLLGWQRR